MDRQQTIDAETAWEIHKRELRSVELRQLADSINDNARMARNTLTAALLVALYLGVTLLSSTDLNLFLNGQVVLPQVGAGVSVVQSYIFAPPVFLFLHVQALLLLAALAHKIRVFNSLIDGEDAARQAEYRAWLSGFAFVQVFQDGRGVLHPARLVTWIGVNAVPLALLFAIDVSFVRYQSDEITWVHHGLFLADLLAVARFNWQVFDGGPRIWWDRLVAAPLAAWRERRVSASALALHMVGLVWVGWWQAVAVAMAVAMALVLLFEAQPPRPVAGDAKAIQAQRDRIWRQANETVSVPSKAEGSLEQWFDGLPAAARDLWARSRAGENLLDAGPCEWWGAACRYLDVRGEQLVARSAEERFRLTPAKPDDAALLALRRAYAEPVDVSRRRFRFARMDRAFAPGLVLKGADISSASALQTDLTGATLAYALGNGADLRWAQLQGAHLLRTQLQGAYLLRAQLQGADLGSAQLQGADLWQAQLQGAYLGLAQLRGADLRQAQLQGAYLWQAQLQGAGLGLAQFQGANLGEAQLQGAYLGQAQFQGAYGKPQSLHLADLTGATYRFAPLTEPKTGDRLLQPVEDFLSKAITDDLRAIKARGQGGKTVADVVRERVLAGVERGVFDGWAPGPAHMVVHNRPPEDGWPASPTTEGMEGKPFQTAMAELITNLACGDEHAARGSLRQWQRGFLSSRPDDDVKIAVHAALRDARAKAAADCPGLHAIPEAEWQEFVNSREAFGFKAR